MSGETRASSGKANRIVLSAFVLVGSALILVSLFPETFILRPVPESQTVAQRKTPQPPPVSPAGPDEITFLPIAADAAGALAAPDATAEDDLSTVELLITEYGKHLRGNPVGENNEITAALLGKNPSRVAFLESHGPFLDGSGRLIDRWGTPYAFHQISGSQTEIRSAGPDRELHTSDDLVR